MNTSFLPVHIKIYEKLEYFLKNNKVPHIIFHGSSGTGKKTIMYDFINKIYKNDLAKIKSNVMFVNCAHGKGIKFIRDDLKFFAKTNVHLTVSTEETLACETENINKFSEGTSNLLINHSETFSKEHEKKENGVFFKTIVLLNADYLTIDAQSALRRCIELFSYNTRFFIIVENKNKLLCPILSRFCEIYVPEYKLFFNSGKYERCTSQEDSFSRLNFDESNNFTLNLHQYNLNLHSRSTETHVLSTLHSHENPNKQSRKEKLYCILNNFYKTISDLSLQNIETPSQVRKTEEGDEFFEVDRRKIKGFSGTECRGEPNSCSMRRQINRFGAAEVKDEFLGTKCREINKFDESAAETKDNFLGTNCKNNDISIEKYVFNLANDLYNDGYSCLDVIKHLEELPEEENETFLNVSNTVDDKEPIKVKNTKKYISNESRLKILMRFYKIKSEFRNEKLLMVYIFNMFIFPDIFDEFTPLKI